MDLKKLRKKAGLTQLDLAYQAGLSRFRIFLIEKGYQKPTAEEAKKLRRFFGAIDLGGAK